MVDIKKVVEENLPVAKKLVQLHDDLGEEEKARRARDELDALWQRLQRRHMRKDEIIT